MSRAEDSSPGLLSAYLGRQRELHQRYRGRVEEADRLAAALAARLNGGPAIVARVSGSTSGAFHADMPPEAWLLIAADMPGAVSEGYYYIAVDPKTFNLILARVAGVERPQLLDQSTPIHVPLERPHPLTVLSNVSPLRLTLEPMLAVHLDPEARGRIAAEGPEALAGLEPVASTPPPDPGAPVAIPSPATLEALLAPKGEVTVGALAVGDAVYETPEGAIPVSLPWSVMVKHVLVTGTTGSGKTSLVKNMLYSALRRVEGLKAVILDASGDYVAAGFPGAVPPGLVDRYWRVLRLYGYRAEPGRPLLGPSLKTLAAIPCHTRGAARCDPEGEAGRYAAHVLEGLEPMYSRWGCKPSLEEVGEAGVEGVYRAAYRVECGGETLEAELHVAPGRIVLGSVAELAGVDPYMTDRARDALPYIASRTKARSMRDLLEKLQDPARAERELGVHRQTLAHLASRLRVLESMDLIDTGRPRGPPLGYAQLRRAMERLSVEALVVDLSYAAQSAPREANPTAVRVLLAYHTLRTMLSSAEREAEHRALLVVDEAHLFFPRGGEAYEKMLTAAIERLARLGRSRGIAIVFSTHREQDLSPTVQTLANTRIYLRTDRRTAEELPLPRDLKTRLPYYADHAGVLASYAVRGSYLGVVGAPTPLGHRTV